MSKRLEECAKVKSQLKVTDLFSSAEGSEMEGMTSQFKKVVRKRKHEHTGDSTKTYPQNKWQTNIKTPSPNPKPRMTSTPKTTTNSNPLEGEDIVFTPELELLEKKLNITMAVNMATYFTPIQSSIDKILNSSNIIENQQRWIEDLTMENCKLKSEVFNLRGQVYDLKDRINAVENRALENNLIFHGIPDSENEYLNQLVDRLQHNFADTIDIHDDELQLQRARAIQILSCKRLGPYQENRTRPIRVEFMYKWDAHELFENRFYLGRVVYINQEYNAETERKRKLLWPILKATKQYNEYKGKSKLEEDKLVINGRRYGRSNLHQLLDKLKPLIVSMKENPDTVGFFGELCPFSSFYESEFMWDGHIYHSSEQYIQHQKAKFWGDTAAVNEILSAKTALQCKQAARHIENYNHDEWIRHAKTKCLKGLTAKFNQNPKIKLMLLNTHNKTLVEYSWDNVWGTGCPLDKPGCLNPENWEEPGLLGEFIDESSW